MSAGSLGALGGASSTAVPADERTLKTVAGKLTVDGAKSVVDMASGRFGALDTIATGDTVIGARPSQTQTCTTTIDSPVVTVASTATLVATQEVTGVSGIAADTQIYSVDSPTQITLTKNATASGSRTLTFGEVALVLDLISTRAQPVAAQTGTTYSVVVADASNLVTLGSASDTAVTLPQDSVAAIPIGQTIAFLVLGAGQVTWSAGAGATLRVSGLTAKSRAQYARVWAQKVAANTWSLWGDLAAS